MGVGYMRGKKC